MGALDNLQGVRSWLQHLSDNGPSVRPSGRAGAAARDRGYTDFVVTDSRTNKRMLLSEYKIQNAKDPTAYIWVEYVDNLEDITEAGRKALAET